MSHRLDRVIDGVLWALLALLIAGGIAAVMWAVVTPEPSAAQAERLDPEFVRVNKTVEAVSYDSRGARSGSWTEVITMMRHRPTGACWIGSYVEGSHIVWTPAPPAVCK